MRGFDDWASAKRNATTYDTADIFQKTLVAARKVRDGVAAYERDSVLLDAIQYDWPLLASLLLVANCTGRLNVVDFGGALGTSYRQNKKFLDLLPCSKKWAIIEQSRFVQMGKQEFETNELFFFESLKQIDFDVDVVLMGGSICYIEEPYKVLDRILEMSPKFILITRTPFSNSSEDSLSVQIVPPIIYSASYPIWTFSENRIKQYLSKSYTLIEDWFDRLQADEDAYAMGMVFMLKQ